MRQGRRHQPLSQIQSNKLFNSFFLLGKFRALGMLRSEYFSVCFILFCCFGFLLGASTRSAFGEVRVELEPSIKFSQTYDDNIFLVKDDPEADFITAVSPAIRLQLQKDKDQLRLSYSPTFVWYADHPETNTVRQFALLDGSKDLATHLTWKVRDSFIRSEEPQESEREILTVRRSRNIFWRNSLSSDVSYQFGPRNFLTGGYNNEILQNEDPSLPDVTIQGPFGSLAYWPNIRNGFDFSLKFSRAEFEQVSPNLAVGDFDGFTGTTRYTHQFNPSTRTFLDYSLDERNFQNITPDFQVHTGKIGLNHDLSKYSSLLVEAGYFVQLVEGTENTNGQVFTVGWQRQTSWGNLSFNGRMGWNEFFLEAEPLGFTRFRSVGGNVRYQLTKDMQVFALTSIQELKSLNDQRDVTYGGTVGVREKIFRWYSVSLEYSYRARNSDIPINEYIDNQIMFLFSFSRPSKWVW